MRYQHSGYTLIELLVAMMLGLFILAGIQQINASSKKTYQISTYSAGLQDDLRNANYNLSQIARKSGYRSAPWKSMEDTFLADATFTKKGQVVVGSDGATNDVSDSFSIRYQGSGNGLGVADNVVIDCIGESLDADDIAIITFDIDQNTLRCTTNNETQGTIKTEKLVDNIENMQILYGIDTDGNNYANHYINATSVTTWEKVTSIRIALLLKATHQVYNLTDTRNITLNDITLPAPNDRFMRMKSVSTISLRNTIP
jgi:type IV pilus assembly protein PilW